MVFSNSTCEFYPFQILFISYGVIFFIFMLHSLVYKFVFLIILEITIYSQIPSIYTHLNKGVVEPLL